MKKDPRAIIRRPIITEKGTNLRAANNSFVFVVDRDANKIEIKNAIEEIFEVKVSNVRTISVKGKARRRGQTVGYQANWKKAIVTLGKDETIDVFDQV